MDTSVISPQVSPASTFQQLVIDLETAMMMPWKTFVVVHDDSTDYAAISMLVKQVRLYGSFSVINLGAADQITRWVE